MIMGDVSIATDILSGVIDAMDAVGWELTVSGYTEGPLDPLNPGAGRPKTEVNFPLQGFIYEYDDEHIDGTNVLAGDRQSVLSIDGLTDAELKMIAPGSYLIDGTDKYAILKPRLTKVSGVPVVAEAQLRKK